MSPFLRTIERQAKRSLARSLLFFFGKAEARTAVAGPLRSIAILAQEKLGDAILLTPLLRNLRRALPEAKIHIVALSPVFPFFERDANVDVVHRVKQDYPGYFRRIRQMEFDLLFSPKDHPSFTFLYQARIIRARNRVGIDHPGHRGFFHHLLEIDFHQHIIEKNCALLDYLGLADGADACRPYLPPEPVAREIAGFIGRVQQERPTGINLSAGEPAREWPVEKWQALLQRLDGPVVVLGMPDKAGMKARLETEFAHVLPSPQTRNIYEAGEIIRHLRLLITPDTALVHVASCYATPVVGLYRADPVHVRRFAPYRVAHRQILAPASQVAAIPVDQVVNATNALLQELHAGPAVRV